MRTVCLFFLALILSAVPCFPVTVMKNVGHGDCYVVISDGRVVVVDLGPASSANGLVSLLQSDYSHYDRIVITHVHADHVGGFITAEQYAKQTETALSTDMLVSNRGAHDLNLVVRDSTVRQLADSLRGRSIVGLREEALDRMVLNDEHIEVRGFALREPGPESGENVSSLILKVTEIRDGRRCATLFLGDIEQAQQLQLLNSPNAAEIFRDVRAVTLPHHGRAPTLARGFLGSVRRLAGEGVVALHSDAAPLDPQVAQEAAESGVSIRSTASEGGDVLVNLFEERTYHQVGTNSTKLPAVVKQEKRTLIQSGEFTVHEIVDAVSVYCRRSPSAPLKPGTVLSIPNDTWVRGEITRKRQAFTEETDRLVSQLRSPSKPEVAEARKLLLARFTRLSKAQVSRISEVVPGLVEEWELQHASPVEREIRQGLKKGWVVKRNENIDENKLFVYGGKTARSRYPSLRYVVKESGDGTWHVYTPGKKDRRGIPSYGRRVGIMRPPQGVNIIDRTICEYCGKEAYGWCTIRHKYVCESHRYFSQDGTNWICP